MQMFGKEKMKKVTFMISNKEGKKTAGAGMTGSITLTRNFENQLFFNKTPENLYSFVELKWDGPNYNVKTETKKTVKGKKSGLGRAVGGGLLFGPVGAVVGAVTGKDAGTEHVDVKQTENEILTPGHLILKNISNGTIHTFKFSTLLGKYNQINSLVADLVYQDDIASQTQELPTPDVATQLREFKSLLDDGIITQEEFDRKKAEILK